jgi:hypothetical protein
MRALLGAQRERVPLVHARKRGVNGGEMIASTAGSCKREHSPVRQRVGSYRLSGATVWLAPAVQRPAAGNATAAAANVKPPDEP